MNGVMSVPDKALMFTKQFMNGGYQKMEKLSSKSREILS